MRSVALTCARVFGNWERVTPPRGGRYVWDSRVASGGGAFPSRGREAGGAWMAERLVVRFTRHLNRNGLLGVPVLPGDVGLTSEESTFMLW